MKNIHILPTDKRSFIYKDIKGNFGFSKDWIEIPTGRTNQHIYITSNEEIKEGDWYYYFGHIINYECDEHTLTPNCKKIILTTDQDLIKDGVQAIDDEFLEWFVKNPSCESVEVDSIETNPDYKSNWENRFTYKIIIPKEEAKPHSFCETPDEKCTMNYCDENGCQNRKRELVEPKQETLEEVGEVKRTDLYYSILSIVKQIPRENVESDAMDAQSCAYEIEQLFYNMKDMEKVKEQIVMITNRTGDVNSYLKYGWRVVSITSGNVSTGGTSQVDGKFCFVLEK